MDIIVEFQGTGWGLVHTASVNIPVECGNYYYGTNCEGFDCNGNPCQNDGACVAPDVCNCDNTGKAIFIATINLTKISQEDILVETALNMTVL